jgi:maltose alpha-D-glucosyltransferase/alpha-amylase
VSTFEARSLSELLRDPPRELEALLTEHIRGRRWFRGKARSIRALDVLDFLPLTNAPDELALIVLRVSYDSRDGETYVLPLAFSSDAGAASRLCAVRLSEGQRSGALCDPSGSDALSNALLQLFVRAETRGAKGRVSARPSAALEAKASSREADLRPRVPTGEQSNTTVFFGRELMIKLFRQLERGQNPDVELNELLWARGYRHIPEPLGSVDYQLDGTDYTLGIAQRFVPSEGIAWEVTLEILARSFEVARTLSAPDRQPVIPSGDLLATASDAPPDTMDGFISAYAPFATLLGERTAQLHIALASEHEQPAFAPEPLTLPDQKALVAATQTRIAHAFELLASQLAKLPADVRPLAEEVLRARDTLARKLDVLDRVQVHASRIRCHGDYHLGQVLYGDNDFTILDFEGEPAQSIEARRHKLSALYDVCGMIRSFHYAATVALYDERWSQAERAVLSGWADAWYRWISAAFLCAYLRKARQAHGVFIPNDASELRALLQLHLVDKCSYELSYELNNRPAWVRVPLAGLLDLAKGDEQR